MKKVHKGILVIVSVVLVIAVLSWLTWWVLPNIWVVHLVPLEEKVHPIPQDGSAILVFKNSINEGHRVIESTKIGWAGLWPFIIVGIILGTVAGYVTGYRKGYSKGFPEREFVDFARKSLAHLNVLTRIAEQKESNAARMLSKSEEMDLKSRQRNVDSAKASKEADRKSDEADKRMVIAEGKIREAESVSKELAKAQVKIQRLEGKKAHQAKKEGKTIDEIDKAD